MIILKKKGILFKFSFFYMEKITHFLNYKNFLFNDAEGFYVFTLKIPLNL